jgi:hypothetical protein
MWWQDAEEGWAGLAVRVGQGGCCLVAASSRERSSSYTRLGTRAVQGPHCDVGEVMTMFRESWNCCEGHSWPAAWRSRGCASRRQPGTVSASGCSQQGCSVQCSSLVAPVACFAGTVLAQWLVGGAGEHVSTMLMCTVLE